MQPKERVYEEDQVIDTVTRISQGVGLETSK